MLGFVLLEGMKEPDSEVGKQARTSPPVRITVRVDRLIFWLAALCVLIELAFVFLDFGVNYSRWSTLGPMRRMFNITREDSLASWFGVSQTLLAACTLWFLVAVQSAARVSRPKRVGWWILAGFFTYLAADDGAEIHERLGSAFGRLQERAQESQIASGFWSRIYDWFPSYEWQIVCLPVLILLGFFMLAFLWRELKTRRSRLTLLIAVGLMAVAVGLDFVEGLEPDHQWNLHQRLTEVVDLSAYTEAQFDEEPFESVRHFSKSLEEFMEMLSMTLLWLILIAHLARIAPRLDLHLQLDPDHD